MLLKNEFDNVVDKHDCKAVEVAVTKRKLIQREIKLFNVVGEDLDHALASLTLNSPACPVQCFVSFFVFSVDEVEPNIAPYG